MIENKGGGKRGEAWISPDTSKLIGCGMHQAGALNTQGWNLLRVSQNSLLRALSIRTRDFLSNQNKGMFSRSLTF